MLNTTSIPASRVPIIEAKQETITREWFRYLYNLFVLTGSGNATMNLDEVIAELNTLSAQISPAYGAFRRNSTATVSAIDTPTAVEFEFQDISVSVDWSATYPSRIYVRKTGVYNFQFSAQMTKTGGSLGYAYIWPAINGVDVPSSNSRLAFQGANSDTVPAWNFLLNLNADDYFELKWAADSVNISIVDYTAISFAPDIPSVLLTVDKV